MVVVRVANEQQQKKNITHQDFNTKQEEWEAMKRLQELQSEQKNSLWIPLFPENWEAANG